MWKHMAGPPTPVQQAACLQVCDSQERRPWGGILTQSVLAPCPASDPWVAGHVEEGEGLPQTHNTAQLSEGVMGCTNGGKVAGHLGAPSPHLQRGTPG